MPQVQFRGRVLPDAHLVSVQRRTIRWQAPEIGLDCTFTVQIESSVVTVECDANRLNERDVSELYMRALDLARLPVDLVAFSQGWGLTVVLDRVVRDGTETTLQFGDPNLKAVCTAFDLSEQSAPKFHAALEIFTAQPRLFIVLNDLIAGLTSPHQAPRNAAQAVEEIRRLVAPQDTKVTSQWAVMRSELRLSEEYLKYVTDHGTAPRHGDKSHIGPDIVREMNLRGWAVMNRYMEYLMRDKNLPEAEYPLL